MGTNKQVSVQCAVNPGSISVSNMARLLTAAGGMKVTVSQFSVTSVLTVCGATVCNSDGDVFVCVR